MNNQRYSPEFKDEAVRQVVERGYTAAEVSGNLGVSQHSLYKWVNGASPNPAKQKDDELIEAKKEILKLCSDLKPTEKERDIQGRKVLCKQALLLSATSVSDCLLFTLSVALTYPSPANVSLESDFGANP